MNDEPDVYSSDERIEAIFQAADAYSWARGAGERKLVDRTVADAIDAAMSHAYAEGRDDERRENNERELEKAARLMNETGQGEHGNVHPVFADILNTIGGKRAA